MTLAVARWRDEAKSEACFLARGFDFAYAAQAFFEPDRLGLSQAELASRIQVSLDTIRNWEQGKRSPTGAAKALLKVLDKAPEAALAALY